MPNRRIFIASIPSATAAVVMSAAKAATAQESPEFHLGNLAEAMKAKYGGQWKSMVNYSSKIAGVIKD